MIITKIRTSGKKVSLEWAHPGNEESQPEVHTMTCRDEPLPELGQALDALIPYVANICEWDGPGGISVSGVSLTYKDDVMGTQIICKKKLESGAVMTFNTPHLKAEQVTGGGAILPDGCEEAIERVILEAERYLKGERSQVVIPFDSDGKEEEPERATEDGTH